MIRSFLNADLPILHRLWIEHWSTIGPPPAVSEAQFEQAVLSRTFFRADQLIVSEEDGVPRGWLHFCSSPSSPAHYVVPAICLDQEASAAVANELLDEAARLVSVLGGEVLEVGVVRDDQFGYAGLDPIGHGVGIPFEDWRLQQALESAGFQVIGSAVAMVVSVPGFRPPVNREALQYRRSTQLQTGPFHFQTPRQAAGMSHLDLETLSLLERSGQVLAAVNVWLSDPEAEVMTPSLMILDLAGAHARGQLEPAEAFLVGAAIQAAAHRFVTTVETSVDEDKEELRSQLESLQFAPARRGSRWARHLAR